MRPVVLSAEPASVSDAHASPDQTCGGFALLAQDPVLLGAPAGVRAPRQPRWQRQRGGVGVLLLILIVVIGLPAAWLTFAWNWSYSKGDRAGWVQKFSEKGWLCKTWEGELALVSMPGAIPEKFQFTVWNEEVASRINKLMGKRVSLTYEQKIGLPTSCLGETRYYVVDVHSVDEPAGLPGLGGAVAAQPSGVAAPQPGSGVAAPAGGAVTPAPAAPVPVQPVAPVLPSGR